jgi:hypothetical protein
MLIATMQLACIVNGKQDFLAFYLQRFSRQTAANYVLIKMQPQPRKQTDPLSASSNCANQIQ